jgi:hypothetical protein
MPGKGDCPFEERGTVPFSRPAGFLKENTFDELFVVQTQ